MENQTISENIGERIFYIVLGLLIAVSIGATYYRIVILKDYQIVAQVSCDPTQERCFVYECDPEIDGECSEIPEENISYYKNISKKAANIYACENTSEKLGCGEELSCTAWEFDCSYTYCDPSQLLEGERCSE